MRKQSWLLEPKQAAEVFRRKEGGLLIDFHGPEYWEYHTASGTNLARVLARIGSDVDFILITAFRPFDEEEGSAPVPRSKNKNRSDFYQIPGQIRAAAGSKRIGAYWLVGHWSEPDPDGQIVDSLEYSWMLVKDDPNVSEEAWLGAAQSVAAQYNQFGFIIRLNGEMTVRRPDGSVFQALSTDRAVEDAWKNLAKLRASGEAHGYTELRKMRERGRIQPIVFQDKEQVLKTSSYHAHGAGKLYDIEFFLVEPHNNSAKMGFHYQGIKHGI